VTSPSLPRYGDSVIHYTPVPPIHVVGNLFLHPFGLLVATGVLSGAVLIHKRARAIGIPREHVDGLIHWAVVPGFICAHLFEMLFYQWDKLMAEGPILLLKFWDGISSYGGFIGAVAGMYFYWWRVLRRGRFPAVLIYTDLLIEGTVLGWVFGRLGCTITLDHPGSVTDAWIAWERGGVGRHNLGFYEFLFTLLLLFPATLIIRGQEKKRHWGPGYITAIICMLYAPTRFVLDLFRQTDGPGADTRFFGLTFAHYCSILLVIVALGVIRKLRSRDLDEAAKATLH
jgi:phosphatidylglycerol:prolipoprotein diacylglycerol transferase